MKRTTWLAACMAAMMALLAIGCENGSSNPEPVAVESVTLNATTLTLAPGAKEKVTATVLPENADDKTVAWLSSDAAVATVGADGTVTAVKAGTATITARAGDKAATCNITVESTDAEKFEINGNGMLTKYTGTDTDVTIPEGVTSIGSDAFENCTSLESVEIPDGVTSIGGGAFWNCKSLASVTIPSGVTSIEGGAFSGCTSLTSVTIPASVTKIRYSVFEYCTSLAKVFYDGTKEDWERIEKAPTIFLKTNVTKITCTDGTVTVSN